MKPNTHHASAVIRVGGGRGFVIETVDRQIGDVKIADRLVVTASHCLPALPPCDANAYLNEITYQSLLGPIGGRTAVWAECLFVDPRADIAVLGCPDDQELGDQAEAYWELTESIDPLMIADAKHGAPAWLLSLDGKWGKCTVQVGARGMFIKDAHAGIHGGMSGSPILDGKGNAIGVVCCSHSGVDGLHTSGTQARLTNHLPAWLVRALER